MDVTWLNPVQLDEHDLAGVVALARDEQRRPIGMLSLSLPRRDNTHVASVVVTVDPRLRRQGLGRRLLETGLARVRDEGRTLLLGYGVDTPALAGFATAMGMELALAHRRLEVPATDQATLAPARVIGSAGCDLLA